MAAARDGAAVVWELLLSPAEAAAMTARAQLLSGQRQDTQVGSAPLDTAVLLGKLYKRFQTLRSSALESKRENARHCMSNIFCGAHTG